MSALRYWEDNQKEEEEELDDLELIFERCHNEVIDLCKKGVVTDDNAIISQILNLMERVIPKILNSYKEDNEEYESKCLATATALRVTISTFMPIERFMDIMHTPQMKLIDKIVDDITEHGKSEAKVDDLTNIFKSLKIKPESHIYG